jgi:hypothetical protein
LWRWLPVRVRPALVCGSDDKQCGHFFMREAYHQQLRFRHSHDEDLRRLTRSEDGGDPSDARNENGRPEDRPPSRS